jgi:hypothetical protein
MAEMKSDRGGGGLHNRAGRFDGVILSRCHPAISQLLDSMWAIAPIRAGEGKK